MIVEWVWLSVWLVCVVALIFVCFGCSLVVWFVGLVCDFGGLLLSCLVVCFSVVALLLLIVGLCCVVTRVC